MDVVWVDSASGEGAMGREKRFALGKNTYLEYGEWGRGSNLAM